MRRLISGLIVGVLVSVAACGGSSYSTAPSNGGNKTGTGGSTTNAIAIGDNFFNPNATTVPVGTTVTWTWSTGTTHNVTFTDGTTSGSRSSGTYSRTFNTAGSYQYQCTIHSGMTGTITVQ